MAEVSAELLEHELRLGYLLTGLRNRLGDAVPKTVADARYQQALDRRKIHAKRAQRAIRLARGHQLGRFLTPSERAWTHVSGGVRIPVAHSGREAYQFAVDDTPTTGASGDQLEMFGGVIDHARGVVEAAAVMYESALLSPAAASAFRKAIEAASAAIEGS